MSKTIFALSLISVALMAISCVTSKTIENEKRMEEWLTQATMPVTVMDQTAGPRCRPSLHCYTLIDAGGKVHQARNVRHFLPRVIPEDTSRIRTNFLERLLLGER
ncbi:MAG TPA: hypothetical protein VK168_13655 [Saprospiraceae bacterium]|nr:hypothetical protein [Saprospiraceae bacterium]